ncbi:MAG: exo-alpha-sialidase, partial [Myxococcales bacterium]|nr:exo-alpha-sialidase [Myxococcales bacterium]
TGTTGDTLAIDLQPEVTISEQGTYPRAAERTDGTLFVAYEGPLGDEKALLVAKSDNGGLSWSEAGVIAHDLAEVDLANPMLIERPNEGLLVAYRRHDQVDSDYVYRLLVSELLGNQTSWQFKGEIEIDVTAPRIWEPFLLQLPDNQLQVYYAREPAFEGDQQIVMRRSFDDAQSWGMQQDMTVVASMVGSREGMPSATVMADGNLLVVFESFRNPGDSHFVIRSVESTDGGLGWSDQQDVYVPVDPMANAGAPCVTTLADGRLLVSFMTDEDSLAHDWPGHASVKLMVSDGVPGAGTLSWHELGVTIAAPADAFWPAVLGLEDGGFLVTYDRGGPKARRGALVD